MDGDGCGESQEKYPEDQAVCYEDRAVEQSDPDKADRDNFDSEGNCFVNHEVGDVRTEFRVGEKPLITVFVATQKECGCKKQKWCRRQYREEGTQNAQSKGCKSKYCIDPFHFLSVSGVMVQKIVGKPAYKNLAGFICLHKKRVS